MRIVHSARSRASINCTGSSGEPGASTSPPLDAHGPIRETVSLIARAGDQPGPNDQRFLGKPFLGFLFGQSLEWAVGLITTSFHRLKRLLVRIRTFVLFR